MMASGSGWGVNASVVLADDTEQAVSASPGLSLLDAMSDMTDQWQGGACGGLGACSTCRSEQPSSLCPQGSESMS